MSWEGKKYDIETLSKIPAPFKGQDSKKKKGTWNSDKSLFRLQNKFRKIPLLVIYCLSLMMQYETEMPQDISPPAGTLQACWASIINAGRGRGISNFKLFELLKQVLEGIKTLE